MSLSMLGMMGFPFQTACLYSQLFGGMGGGNNTLAMMMMMGMLPGTSVDQSTGQTLPGIQSLALPLMLMGGRRRSYRPSRRTYVYNNRRTYYRGRGRRW